MLKRFGEDQTDSDLNASPSAVLRNPPPLSLARGRLICAPHSRHPREVCRQSGDFSPVGRGSFSPGCKGDPSSYGELESKCQTFYTGSQSSLKVQFSCEDIGTRDVLMERFSAINETYFPSSLLPAGSTYAAQASLEHVILNPSARLTPVAHLAFLLWNCSVFFKMLGTGPVPCVYQALSYCSGPKFNFFSESYLLLFKQVLEIFCCARHHEFYLVSLSK